MSEKRNTAVEGQSRKNSKTSKHKVKYENLEDHHLAQNQDKMVKEFQIGKCTLDLKIIIFPLDMKKQALDAEIDSQKDYKFPEAKQKSEEKKNP